MGPASIVVPMRFGDVDVLVQGVPTNAAGSEDTAVSDRLVAAYSAAEAAILAVASSVAGTIGQLTQEATKPSQVQVEFGVGLTLGGDVILVKGEATLTITLTYVAA